MERQVVVVWSHRIAIVIATFIMLVVTLGLFGVIGLNRPEAWAALSMVLFMLGFWA